MVEALQDEFLHGESLDLGQLTMSRDDIVAFASVFDAQPFHMDEEAASSTVLGGLAASGWHTSAIVLNLLRDALASKSVVLDVAGAGDLMWSRPVRPGNQLSCRANWLRSPQCACREVSLTAMIEAVNQDGMVAMRWWLDCFLRPSLIAQSGRNENCVLQRGRPARVIRRSVPHAIKHFDDVRPGDEIALGAYHFSLERVAAFDRLVRGTRSAQKPAGSGTMAPRVHPSHLPAAWMQLMVRHYKQEVERIRGLGGPIPMLGPASGVKHLRWERPVDVGETLTFRGWAERKIDVPSQRGWGLLVVGAEGLDASGETVVSFYPQMLLERLASQD